MANPTKATWQNPTIYVDGSPYGQSNNAGYQLGFDKKAAVSIPLVWGTEFDFTTLDSFKALKQGTHTVELAPVSKGGVVGAFSSASFQIELAPAPVTNLAVA